MICPECGGKAVKNGTRKGVIGRRQAYICMKCWYQWVEKGEVK